MGNDNTGRTSNKILTERLAQGDSDAFDQIYNRYWLSLFNVAYGLLQDKTVSQDVVQDIFLSLWFNRGHSTISNLENYLFRSVKLKAFQQLRNGKVALKHLDKINMISFVNETENRLNFHEVEAHLNHSMEKLPVKCRKVFYLSRFEQLSNREIASQLNVSIKTVEGHISYALKRFRVYFKEYIASIVIFTQYLF